MITGKVESSDLRYHYFYSSLIQAEGLSLTLEYYIKFVDIV